MPYPLDVRPLFHPALEDTTVEGILYALSDPVRVAIYADIASQQCTQNCSSFLTVSDPPVPKSTLSQHFRILRENGLVRAERHGVEMRFAPRCAEIETRFPGLIPAILNAHRIESGEKVAKKSRMSPKSSGRR
ncbi:MAG TPA: helix-turn-helix domain-containing protein [Acidobacteriaceae bacterium]|nr:helix-turn-helix domain-containing protein [Acidobacteriaceae bacterium]